MTDLLSGPEWVQGVVLTCLLVVCVLPTTRVLTASIHALQQDDYSNRRFWGWYRTSGARTLLNRSLALLLAAAVAGAILSLSSTRSLSYPIPALVAVTVMVADLARKRAPRKKPLVYTGRAERLL